MSVDADSHWHTLPSVLWESNMASKTCRRCCKDWDPLIRWRHHCRFCGQLVCDNCSVPRESYAHIQKPSRTCWPCSALIRALLMEEALHWEFYERLEERTHSRNDSPSTIADEVVDQQLARMPTCCDIVTDLGDLNATDDSTDNSFTLDTPTKQHRIMLEEMGSPERTRGFSEGKASDACVVPVTPLPQDISKPASFYRSPMAVESPTGAATPTTAAFVEQAEHTEAVEAEPEAEVAAEAGTEETAPWSDVKVTPATEVTADTAQVESAEAEAEAKTEIEASTHLSLAAAEGVTPPTSTTADPSPASTKVAEEGKEGMVSSELPDATEDAPALTEKAEVQQPRAEQVVTEEASEDVEGSQAVASEDAVVVQTATGEREEGGGADAAQEEAQVRQQPAAKKNKKKGKGK